MTKNEWKTNIKQLFLLLWKNFRLQLKSPIGLALEILVPAIFAFILLPIRSIVDSTYYEDSILFPSFKIKQLPFVFTNYSIAYQPNNSQLISDLMKSVGSDLNLIPEGFGSEEEAVDFATSIYSSKRCLGVISFTNQAETNLVYKIRLSHSPRNNPGLSEFSRERDWKTNALYPFFPVLGPRNKEQINGGTPGYFAEGFLSLQKSIDFNFLNRFNNSAKSINLDLKRFPYPPYNNDPFVAIIQALFPFIIMLSFIFTVVLTAKAIVAEKESGIKEGMKLMGMKPWIYWLSWYIKTMGILLPAIIFIVISFKTPLTVESGAKASIINKTDAFLFFLFLILYASSSVTLTFVCSTFFKKANSGAAGAGVIWFFSYLPYIFISLRYEKLTLGLKVISCFVNNLAMSLGIQLIGMFEGKGTGIDFSNWSEGLSVDDSFSLLNVMIIMLANNLINLILLYYFDNVLPGDKGIAKDWLFPFHFILKKKKKRVNSEINLKKMDNNLNINGTYENSIDNGSFENESVYSNKKIGIKIERITKKFKQLGMIKQAVGDLSLNIYEGQISVLLGHNGAGKSTTISMITGLTEPTSGRILVNDIDVVKQTKQARKCIGFCPQYNLLFDNLTVYEHLKFFSKLKENFNESEIDNMLDLINLKDKKHALSKTLSGGMKRKLCVAIAFIGNSSIVILDEPSKKFYSILIQKKIKKIKFKKGSGMDPQARHSTWTLLQKFKKERKCTILLTTHFMDEADFLGDRIAIMSKGSLRCCGSPLFLKSKYGSGYNLVLTKMRSVENSVNHDKEIINLVTRLIPNSSLNANLTSEISFILPSEQTARFSCLLDEIDKNRENLDIMNVGISVTTIEDVFLKIGEEGEIEYNTMTNKGNGQVNKAFDDDMNKKNTHIETNSEFENIGLWAGSKKEDKLHGLKFVILQFYALFVKRFIHSIRNKSLFITQLLIPIGCVLINMIYLKYAPIKPSDSPPLTINLGSYQQNIAPFIYAKSDQFMTNIAQVFESNLKELKNTEVVSILENSYFDKCKSETQNIDDFLICLGLINGYYLIDRTVLAASFNENNSIIGHFNNQGYHAPPLILNQITNALLKVYSDKNDATITVVNHPLPRNTTEELNDALTRETAGFNVASGLTFGFSFLIASFAIILIKEKTSNAKHIQYMSGCNSNIYWTSSLLWDMFNYIIPCAIVMVILKIFEIEQFVSGDKWLYFFLLLILNGLAHLPQTYLFSYLFNISATGFAIITSWNILSSQVTLTAVNILSSPILDLSDVARTLEWVFLIIFPNYAFGQGIVDLYENYNRIEYCAGKNAVALCKLFPNPCCRYINEGLEKPCGNFDCFYWNENYFSWEKPGLLRFLVFMIIQFLVQFGIILLYEAGILKKIFYKLRPSSSANKNNDGQIDLEREYGDIKKDNDVVNEENRIRNKSYKNEEFFIVDGITKYYSNFMAVKGISFTLKSSECFGLLGVNGAGKSTSFKMLTGDEYLTKGDASINRISIKNNLKKYQKKLGYCPQFDPLIDQMTVMETMTMYARLRGLKPNIIKNTCLSLINLLDLDDHIEKMCYTLSGGNKRKLSVAIALIGSPLVVLLDEPTSGMDPITRRTLWNCLIKIKNKGKSLILTTHSMDETEVLCSNIGIMVNGEFKCIGSLQHLKSKYGEGYTLMVKICLNNNSNEMNAHQDRTAIVDGNQILIEKNDESIDKNQKVNQFIEFILDKIKNSYVKENRDGFVNIHINDNSTSILSKVFSLIEEIKTQFSIEYYIVTQTKLEQIFLNFASKQIDPETRVVSKKNKKIIRF
uniref:ATP-binding cassette transporter subfamily A member 3 X1 protein n=1 Tax=Brachionus koreanus TaxID=1199090 RepID=A0A1J0MMV7_9BILA|nr:ATP-binding cassette transporter subfamily A member 3 X1 protein [Brachionus koreanus]